MSNAFDVLDGVMGNNSSANNNYSYRIPEEYKGHYSGQFGECDYDTRMFEECERFGKYLHYRQDSNIPPIMPDGYHSCDSMFICYSRPKKLDLSHLDTSQVTSMAEMFAGCYRLISLDLSNLDTSNVKDMSGMFYDCGHLTKLNLSKFNTTNVECMSDMFRGCERLTALDLSNFDTSKVTNMAYMFCGCRSLTALGLSNFDVSKITDMMGMFDGCVSLTEECKSRLKAQGFTVMW